MERKHNFSAGPGTLPVEVLEEVQAEMLEYKDAGASVMEISHRSPEYSAIEESARAHLRSLLDLSEDWQILFLQGGASMQFYQVPLNFLGVNAVADYVITGAWAKKSYAEAKRLGDARVAATGEENQFGAIPDPDTWSTAEEAVYLHYTSNNTIFGTQFRSTPHVDAPLVCDASSDFLGQVIDVDKHGLIYAGAQKNLGPAGTTIVLIRNDFLSKRKDDLPTIMNYGTHTSKLFNTPPVFAVYVVEKVLRWLATLGGIPAMQQRNENKAGVLYERIDRNEFYRGTADVASRSLMNVTFRLPTEDLEAVFIEYASTSGLLSLKGHRSVGGIRASIYNACEPEAVDALVSFMDEFERLHG
ncbi:MAG: 3-phosphoserine/phosphohydroxythreonine transaminase [Rhodothermia bacterium]|nr:MAG: 3-phosphoserine/phosphohydroxythreonine transaminase [Rhodothermia bacterium]